jgi:hypothetical protein
MKFALQTSTGNYVTAINAGGVGGPNDATCPIHTDATIAGAWEGFILQVDDSVNPPTVAIRTQTGNFVTAVNGGGVNGGYAQPIHTDATSVGTWEQFLFNTVAVVQPTIKSSWSADIGGVPVVSNETIRIVIEAEEPVLAGDFGEFLQLFERVFFAIRHDAVALSPILEVEQQQYADPSLLERLDNEFERLWDKLPELEMRHSPLRSLGDGLQLLQFSKNSPIEIITQGLPIVFAIAAIFSGGRVKLPGIEVQLPPLGTGIDALRRALGLGGPRTRPPRGTIHRGVQKSFIDERKHR